MMRYFLVFAFLISPFFCSAQRLHIAKRNITSKSGLEFSKSIRDSTISIDLREEIIFSEVRSGNIPEFYRKLIEIRDTVLINNKNNTIKYFVLPDFLAIGNDDDYFYCPMRPQLAQKVADLLKCSLPTRKISNRIYQNAAVKMVPQPIPPSKAMITVPIFEKHNSMVQEQRKNTLSQFPNGSLTAGNKKDVVISNKTYNDKGLLRVVIYGWHKPDGKAIQPLYNGHSTIHVDYSHGIRFVQNKVWVNGKKTSIQKILKSEILHPLLSDEGVIAKPYYPVGLY